MNCRPILSTTPQALLALSSVILCASAQLLAGQVTLAWDPNSEPDLAGYRIHYGTSAGAYDHVLDVGNVTSSTVTGLGGGNTYWFVATAYNTAGLESDPSNEVSHTIPNEAPTIRPVDDQTVAEDAAVGPVPFTVGWPDNDPGLLTVTASSSNPTLVPESGLVLGGAGADRALLATPAMNAHGSTTITLTASNGEATATTSFLLTVTPVNDPPTISAVADQTTAEDTVIGPVAFTVDDPDDDPALLTVTARSSNTALMPHDRLVLGGIGGSRTLTATPAANAFGSTTLTIEVSDRLATATTSFLLTVTPVNDPPTVSSVPDQTTGEDVPTGPIPFTVGDVETSPDSLVVLAGSSNPDLVPSTGIVFSGTGSSRTVTVTPALGRTGTATITVTVSDGTETASASFRLTVTENSLPPPWTAHDIGAPGLAGTTSFNGTTFTVAGGGTDIGSVSDQFHFVRQTLSGDGEITVRVSSIQNTSPSAKAGVMIRETLNGNSRHALMCVTPAKGFLFLHRSATAGSTATTSGGALGALYPAPANWVRLVRKGSTIKAYKSSNGTKWIQVGSAVSISMASQIHIGLAVTAANNLQRCTATFQNVAVVP